MTYTNTILIVDDEPAARKTLEGVLRFQQYHLVFADNGIDALAKTLEVMPDLILLDVMMPQMDGFEVCRRIRANPVLAEVPIIMVTALDDRAARLHGLEVGADDFVSKPVDRVELRTRVQTITRLNRYRRLLAERAKIERVEEQLRQSNIELSRAYDATLEGWSRALDLRDHETEGHSQRVTELSLRLAQAMGVPCEELAHIRRGALLHDIGKMGIPDTILHKQGPLNDEEWATMRKHPVYAYEMLSPIDFLHPALAIPYCHHERWDGSGYPRGLQGEEIPLAARIFSVIDVWDALRSNRPYRQAWTEQRVREYLCSLAGTHFDPRVVAAFLDLLPITPCTDECNSDGRTAKKPGQHHLPDIYA